MGQDHFQPEAYLDPQEQRKVRGRLEQVDAAAFNANRQVAARTVGLVDINRFERLAKSAAHARALWVAAALTASEKTLTPSPQEIAHLTALRTAYDELAQAYDAGRRMVERGYICFVD